MFNSGPQGEKTMTTTRTIREELERAAELIGGKAWGIDKGKPRIYMPSRRDIKAYFEFPDAAYSSPDDQVSGSVCLGGHRFVVWVAECGQHPNWYESQRKKVFEANRNASLALHAFAAGDEALAEAIASADPDQFDGDQIDEAARSLVNGRTAEARQVLGL
jgi:hypothetical protein